MVKHKDRSQLDLVFSSLSDPTRREILKRLAFRSQKITDIARPYEISLVAVSKHLLVLERSGLIDRSKRGRSTYISINSETLKEAIRYIDFFRQFWNKDIDGLENFLHDKNSVTINIKK